jgi:hypothetical protein
MKFIVAQMTTLTFVRALFLQHEPADELLNFKFIQSPFDDFIGLNLPRINLKPA